MGLKRILALVPAVALLATAAATLAQGDLNACVTFPERRLTDVSLRGDQAVVAWRGSAHNSCPRVLSIEANFSLAAPDGTTLSSRDATFQLGPDETIELRGDFALPAGTRADQIGSLNITYIAR